ncbi:MAG: FKBP-type peptidyl-prolyl cis-trans isomerase, partial [Candidatus Omnitrophica bacterium]|nr:FKBP-type peptidyl-prolyl cis-trans isomerase [Candidatus Omnitrophota bacterium]
EEGTIMDYIEYGKKVKLHYVLKVDGEVVDSTPEGEPFVYVHGKDDIVPGLSKALENHQAGDSFQVTVQPEDGFGKIDPRARLIVYKKHLPKDIDLSIGTELTTQNEQGEKVTGRIIEIQDRSIILDTNHPYAGKKLVFDVKVLDVQ